MGLFQVALADLREGSPTYAERNTIYIGALRPWQVLIPPGVAHGYNAVPMLQLRGSLRGVTQVFCLHRLGTRRAHVALPGRGRSIDDQPAWAVNRVGPSATSMPLPRTASPLRECHHT